MSCEGHTYTLLLETNKKMLKVEGECIYQYMCQELTALISGSIRWQHSCSSLLARTTQRRRSKFQLKQQKMETTTKNMRGDQRVPTFE